MNEQETGGGKPHIEFSKVALLVQFGISTLLTLLSVAAFFMGKDVSSLGMLTGGSIAADGAITSFYLWKAKTENRAKYAERFALKVAEKYGIESALQLTEIVLKE